MAEIEYDAKNNAEAEAAADRALALDPKLVVAMIYKGRVLARRAAESKQADDWKAARSWFIKANHADPDFALPLVQNGRASGRERVCQHGSIAVVSVSLKKKQNKK